MSQFDEDALPGITGTDTGRPEGVRVYDLTAVESGAIAIDELDDGFLPGAAVWLSFLADVQFYILFGFDGLAGGNIAIPDPAARVGSPQQCIRIPADYEYQRKFVRGQCTHWRAIAPDGDAVLRIERVSLIGGASNIDTGQFG